MMKIVWLCNMLPGAVAQCLGRRGNGVWLDYALEQLRTQTDITLHLFCPGGEKSGRLDAQTSFALFSEGAPHKYLPALEAQFYEALLEIRPDVIHIWGTEFAHTLAMVNAAGRAHMDARVVISIQGLCSICARHYCEGLPEWVCRRYTLRDFVKQRNICQQQKRYRRRGRLEVHALQKAEHVIGRTDWDRAITGQIQKNRQYHFCNETLRPVFYQDTWQYEACSRHRVFASSCAYPVKGFHYLLEAMPLILYRYPDATVSVTGSSFFRDSFAGKLRQEYYQRYLADLAKKYGLRDKIHFLGNLDAAHMKRAYLDANVFALPSTIENSPNSLGEAMLLGVPCVAADVGGVRNLMCPGEGYVYQSTAPYMLADAIMQVFEQQEQAAEMGRRARAHALQTHDPDKNLQDLLAAYQKVAGEAE